MTADNSKQSDDASEEASASLYTRLTSELMLAMRGLVTCPTEPTQQHVSSIVTALKRIADACDSRAFIKAWADDERGRNPTTDPSHLSIVFKTVLLLNPVHVPDMLGQVERVLVGASNDITGISGISGISGAIGKALVASMFVECLCALFLACVDEEEPKFMGMESSLTACTVAALRISDTSDISDRATNVPTNTAHAALTISLRAIKKMVPQKVPQFLDAVLRVALRSAAEVCTLAPRQDRIRDNPKDNGSRKESPCETETNLVCHAAILLMRTIDIVLSLWAGHRQVLARHVRAFLLCMDRAVILFHSTKEGRETESRDMTGLPYAVVPNLLVRCKSAVDVLDQCMSGSEKDSEALSLLANVRSTVEHWFGSVVTIHKELLATSQVNHVKQVKQVKQVNQVNQVKQGSINTSHGTPPGTSDAAAAALEQEVSELSAKLASLKEKKAQLCKQLSDAEANEQRQRKLLERMREAANEHKADRLRMISGASSTQTQNLELDRKLDLPEGTGSAFNRNQNPATEQSLKTSTQTSTTSTQTSTQVHTRQQKEDKSEMAPVYVDYFFWGCVSSSGSGSRILQRCLDEQVRPSRDLSGQDWIPQNPMQHQPLVLGTHLRYFYAPRARPTSYCPVLPCTLTAEVSPAVPIFAFRTIWFDVQPVGLHTPYAVATVEVLVMGTCMHAVLRYAHSNLALPGVCDDYCLVLTANHQGAGSKSIVINPVGTVSDVMAMSASMSPAPPVRTGAIYVQIVPRSHAFP